MKFTAREISYKDGQMKTYFEKLIYHDSHVDAPTDHVKKVKQGG